MPKDEVAAARCQKCGGTSFSFQHVIGPADALEAHSNYLTSISALEAQVSQPEAILKERRSRLEDEAAQTVAHLSEKKLSLMAKREAIKVEIGSLASARDRMLAPLKEKAVRIAHEAYTQKAKEDPSVYLDDDLEARMASEAFDKLSSRVINDPGFAKVIAAIAARESEAQSIESSIASIEAQESNLRSDLALRLKLEQQQFEADSGDSLSKLNACRDKHLQFQMRSQVGVVVCCGCGSIVSATPSPMPLDEWMRRVVDTETAQLRSLKLLVTAVEGLKGSIEGLAREVDKSGSTLRTDLKQLGVDVGKSVLAGQSQLAKALQGSFSSIQASMKELVTRANQAQQRQNADDLKKLFDDL